MSLATRFRAPQNRKLTARFAVLAVTATLALAGCGSDDANSTTSKAEPTTSAAVDNEAALTYTGGTAGAADASKDPIVIGYVTQDGGIPAWPETTPSAEAAVDYINKELGGIDGHPLEMRTCLVVSSEEEGQKCGQQFANDPDVRAVVTGNLIVGNASLYDTIGDSKPILGLPTVPADYNSDNNFALFGAGFTGLPAKGK